MKRTEIDFSKHVLKVTALDGVTIYEFKNPDTIHCMLTFINTCGVMTVTGDLGNWVFCREFHPSGNSDSGVSAGYWDEKLQIASEQKAKKYDAEETSRLIKEFREGFEDNYDRVMNKEELEWVKRMEESVDDEHEYVYVAYREKPSSIDYESVPFGEKRHFWLNAVYDGFDAMCEYIKAHNETEDLGDSLFNLDIWHSPIKKPNSNLLGANFQGISLSQIPYNSKYLKKDDILENEFGSSLVFCGDYYRLVTDDPTEFLFHWFCKWKKV